MSSALFLFLIVAQVVSESVYAFGPSAVENNKKGLQEYQAENYTEAFQNFSKALGSDPFNPQLHINLGDSFFKGGEYDKALQSFQSSLEQPKIKPEQKLEGHFNAGNAAREAKKIDEALSHWQKALEIDPQNKMVKTNIELALKQQGGGGGGGGQNDKQDKKEDKDKKDGQGNDKKDQQQKPQPQNQPKPKPQPFKSQELTEQDVKRILEELKRQEQQTRAKQQLDNKKTKDNNPEKDW